MTTPATVFDVAPGRFDEEVVARSSDLPIVVDFWAAWCGPCRTLGPLLEEAVAARGGEVALAKVDVDADPTVAQRYRVQGIPAVKAFRDGEVVAEFTGAVPRPRIEAFLDAVVPSDADRLAAEARTLAATDAEAAAATFARALTADEGHRAAAIGLAELIVEDDPQRAMELVRAHRPDPAAEAVATRAELAERDAVDDEALRARVQADPTDGDAHLELGRARAAEGDYAAAIDHLLAAVRAGGGSREPAREQLLGLFGVLGDDHELVRTARPKLAASLY